MVKGAKANLWPDWAPESLWELLVRWVEWRSIAGYPKSPRLPEAVFAFEVRGGELVAPQGPGFCLTPSTAPRKISRVEEFNVAFVSLETDQQIYILALVEMQGDDWPEGKQWEAFCNLLKLTPKQFKSLLHDALASLLALASARGLA